MYNFLKYIIFIVVNICCLKQHIYSQSTYSNISFGFDNVKEQRNLQDTSIIENNLNTNYQTNLSIDYITNKNHVIRLVAMYGNSIVNYRKQQQFSTSKYNVVEDYSYYNIGFGLGIGKQYQFKKTNITTMLQSTYCSIKNTNHNGTFFGYDAKGQLIYNGMYTYYSQPKNQIDLYFQTSYTYNFWNNFFIGAFINTGLNYIWGNYKSGFSDKLYNQKNMIKNNEALNVNNYKHLRYTYITAQIQISYKIK
jgi:hypothetical protein